MTPGSNNDGNEGILLINLGSPSAPTPEAVGVYLKQFLMDERVIDVPAWIRRLLVHLIIVPRRKGASARLYRSIWTAEGSPLVVNTRALAAGLRRAVSLLRDRGTWARIQANAMAAEVSWGRSAARYAALFRGTLSPPP